MKKFLVLLVVVLLASAAAAFFLHQRKAAGPSIHPADLLPSDCIAFAEIPDVPHSGERFQQTAIYQLWQEPQMQAFLEKPKAKVPWLADFQSHLDLLQKLKPQHAFAGFTDMTPGYYFIAGFSFAGSRADVEKALAEPRAQLRKAWPTGKADVEVYGDNEIQVYTEKENSVAEAFHGNWYFVSNHVDLLKAALDRLDHKTEGLKPALSADEVFKKTAAPLPKEPDLFVFTRVGVLADRVSSLLSAAGQPADSPQLAELKRTKAMALATKIDGLQFRDTIFSYAPGTTPGAPLARHGLDMSTPGTLLYYAAKMPASLAGPDATSLAAITQYAPVLADLDKALAEKNLKFSDLPAAFGPEWNALVDWGAGAIGPSLLAQLDVKDPAKAKAFIETLTGGGSGSPAWEQSNQDGAVLYSPPPQPPGVASFLPQPAIALSEKQVLVGLSLPAVTEALKQGKAHGAGGLASQPAFQTAEKAVQPSTLAFGYLDLRGLVDRSLGMFRPFLLMSLAMNPDSGQYFDAGKLPPTETITKHLGVSIYSQSSTEQGSLIESAGPLTFNQVMAIAVGGAVAAALPMLEQNMQSGNLLPPNLLQPGSASPFPSPFAPVSPPPAPVPSQPAPPAAPATPTNR